MSATAIEELITQRMADALPDYDANQNSGNGNDNGNGIPDSGSGGGRMNVGHDLAYRMPWKTLMKMMTENYCPRSEIKKLETELWNLTVKADKVERSLMDQKVRAYATRHADNKRRKDNNPRDNHAQQPPYKRQNVARAYTVRPGKKREYVGSLELYPCAISANFTTIGRALQSSRTIKELGTAVENARNQRTRIVGIKAEMVKLVEERMLWEKIKRIKTLTTLQMISMLKEIFFPSYLLKPKLELS
ncbi:hypothetical protein Tco_0221188 [Tanacetum coccineum]